MFSSKVICLARNELKWVKVNFISSFSFTIIHTITSTFLYQQRAIWHKLVATVVDLQGHSPVHARRGWWCIRINVGGARWVHNGSAIVAVYYVVFGSEKRVNWWRRLMTTDAEYVAWNMTYLVSPFTTSIFVLCCARYLTKIKGKSDNNKEI